MKTQTPEVSARRIESAPEHYRFAAGGDEARFAVVRNARTVREARAYLPDNYDLMESYEVEENGRIGLVVIIGGVDRLGWTLDDYVIPRLASGLIWAEEIS